MVSLQANWLGPSVSNMARMAVYRKRVGLYRVTVSFPAWPIASARALIWIATSNAVLCWDVAGILWLMKQQGRDNVQLVSHIAPQASHIATRYFDLHLRRRA